MQLHRGEFYSRRKHNMNYKEILYTESEGIAVIMLNRPDKLNAWTHLMAGEVWDAMHRAADDDAVKVIVLTGAGRGFCAGADMSELGGVTDEAVAALDKIKSYEERVSIMMGEKTTTELDPDNKNNVREDFRKRYSYISAIPKPVIAAVNGPAAGIGFILILHCDLRFVSDKASFSTAFSKRGLIAEHGIAWMLPRIVGHANALDLLYSSRLIGADEALSMGLANRVIPADVLMNEVRAYALDLASNVSPRSMRVMKRLVYEALFQTFAEASEASDKELILSLQSEDFKEGIAHFLEKRPPVFKGK
jgi:enoyl-CoA hydratase/carnithine racemase